MSDEDGYSASDSASMCSDPTSATEDSVDVDDDQLPDVPVEFIRDALVKLAPRLLCGVDSLTPDLPATRSPFDRLPRTLPCVFAPPPHLPAGHAIPPTHLLSLVYASPSAGNLGGGSGDELEDEEGEHLVVPIHQLVWADRCKRIARVMALSSCDDAPVPGSRPAAVPPSGDRDIGTGVESSRPADAFELPVLTLPYPLPAAALSTFPTLHTYLHTGALPETLPCDDEEASKRSRPRAQEYEGLWRMCEALGIPGSDEVYRWISPRWQSAARESVASVGQVSARLSAAAE